LNTDAFTCSAATNALNTDAFTCSAVSNALNTDVFTCSAVYQCIEYGCIYMFCCYYNRVGMQSDYIE
jgi:hypothetical protein